jgi:hypothetical protein
LDEQAFSIAVQPDGAFYYVTGYSNSVAFSTTSANINQDMIVLKFTNVGVPVWIRRIGNLN